LENEIKKRNLSNFERNRRKVGKETNEIMVRIWGIPPPWPQTLKDESPSNFSTPGKEFNKEEEIRGRVELLSHNVEMDRMFNRG
jgi:hypothetical protein